MLVYKQVYTDGSLAMIVGDVTVSELVVISTDMAVPLGYSIEGGILPTPGSNHKACCMIQGRAK